VSFLRGYLPFLELFFKSDLFVVCGLSSAKPQKIPFDRNSMIEFFRLSEPLPTSTILEIELYKSNEIKTKSKKKNYPKYLYIFPLHFLLLIPQLPSLPLSPQSLPILFLPQFQILQFPLQL
jgi:hypothetical protein